jgi:UDP-N-acetylglucosamine 2-epimerase
MLIAIVIMTSTGINSFRSNRFIVAHLEAGKRTLRVASSVAQAPTTVRCPNVALYKLAETVAPEAHLVGNGARNVGLVFTGSAPRG